MKVLEIRDLVKTYANGYRALDHLSLSVSSGSVFGLLGLNGAGKTTTIRVIAGLAQKDSGSVALFGKEISHKDGLHKNKVGFVLDEPLYFEWMTATEYLCFIGTMYGLSEKEMRQRVVELLEFFDLSDAAEETIETFSTGMKKKISIAAAIIHNPRLLILDEPLESIDAVAATAIKECIRLMASKGTTIVITSHVIDAVEKLCTEIAIVDRGKNILQSSTSNVRSKFETRLKKRYESLEQLFVDVVSQRARKKQLTWLS
jgi:ABC-2 type transport system ATP-binding protein